jgi:hypothetical protein
MNPRRDWIEPATKSAPRSPTGRRSTHPFDLVQLRGVLQNEDVRSVLVDHSGQRHGLGDVRSLIRISNLLDTLPQTDRGSITTETAFIRIEHRGGVTVVVELARSATPPVRLMVDRALASRVDDVASTEESS